VKPKITVKDSDLIGSLPAMMRAAARARKLSEQTGTAFLVVRNGKIVDLNRKSKMNGRRKRGG
jgi:hypothetical protein